MLILDTPESFEEAANQRDLLADALYKILVAADIISNDAPCEGPALLMIAEQYAEHLETTANSSPTP